MKCSSIVRHQEKRAAHNIERCTYCLYNTQLCLLGILCYNFFLILFIVNSQLCFIVLSAGEYFCVFPSTIPDVFYFHCYFIPSLLIHTPLFPSALLLHPPILSLFRSLFGFSQSQHFSPFTWVLPFTHAANTLGQHSCRHYGLVFGFQRLFLCLFIVRS